MSADVVCAAEVLLVVALPGSIWGVHLRTPARTATILVEGDRLVRLDIRKGDRVVFDMEKETILRVMLEHRKGAACPG